MRLKPRTWFAFTLIYLCFSVYSFIQLTHSIPEFKWVNYPVGGGGGDFHSSTAQNVGKNLNYFIMDWNKYVEEQNRLNFWRNLISAIVFLISAIVSFSSIGSDNIKNVAKYLYGHGAKTIAYIEPFVRIRIEQRGWKNDKDKRQETAKPNK